MAELAMFVIIMTFVAYAVGVTLNLIIGALALMSWLVKSLWRAIT